MANTKNEIKTVKATDLQLNAWYTVKKSGFKKATGKKGDFMSAWFLIENSRGDVVFVNAPSERDTQRYIGIVTACKIQDTGKNGLNVKAISFTEKDGYRNMNFLVEPWSAESAPF